MKNVFIEATNGPQNWGKFMVARFDEEWERGSQIALQPMDLHNYAAFEIAGPLSDEECERQRVRRMPILRGRGWHPDNIIVFDLQTQEGAAFTPGGLASADLHKHKIWVCPLFEPFLTWLYKQDLSDLSKLPKHIDLPDAPFELHGYRREGKQA
jgi:hypothetical protein